MANIKPIEHKAEPKVVGEKKYALIKNVKYGNTPYKIGDKIAIKPEDLEDFKKAKAIKIE